MKNVEIGKRIRQQRKTLNISVVDVAAHTGLSKATIHRYESGEIKNIKLPVINVISDILNVNPAWLVGKSNIKERGESTSVNLLQSIDYLINHIKNSNNLTVGSRQVTEREKTIVIKLLRLVKDILDKGE